MEAVPILRFKPKADVDDGDLTILATAHSKDSTCSSGPGANNESSGHSVTVYPSSSERIQRYLSSI